MAYRTILVHFSALDRADAVMDLAVPLADAHNAHLIGLYVIPQVAAYTPAAVQVTTDILTIQRKYFEDEADQVAAVFKKRAEKGGIKFEWRKVDAEGALMSETVVEHAFAADLVIAGQPKPEDSWAPYSEMPERLMLDSGRPLLMVPFAGKFSVPSRGAMLAWGGTRESAIPLMQNVKHVRILAVNPDNGDDSGFTPSDDIAATLARHGIKTEAAFTMTRDISVADELLSRIADHDCDLLVMGGYGHSPFREMVFGGVTRHILQHMTVPVLLSH